ncbi:hypothetical protein ACQP1O_38000 [Nocardia sp. CA-151230]|uniref:hypothetical protein n=1 Tax=Nocardia sp. CA-151230 TaxID=3239982 RepID=UPI003D8AE76C
MTTPPPAPPSGGQPDHHTNPPPPDSQWAPTQQWQGQPVQPPAPPRGQYPPQQQFGQVPGQNVPAQEYPPLGFGAPQGPGVDPYGQFGTPQAQFGSPQAQFGAQQNQFGAPQGQFGAPRNQFGTPQGQFGQQPPFPAPGQYGAEPPSAAQPLGRNKNRMILLALAGVVVLAVGAVIAVVVTRSDDSGGTQAQTTETSSTAATTTGAGKNDPAAMVLAADDLPVGWTEDTKKEQQTNDGTDEARVSGETPDCTAKLKKEAAPPATKPAAKATSAFGQKGGYGGASVTTTVAFRPQSEIQSEFDEEKDASDNCPTVIYDGMQIIYTKIPNIPAVGDAIIGYQMDATAAGGGQARGLHYVCRSGGKIWYFDYNANINDYHADEADRLFTKALTKWQAGLK